MLIKLIQQVNQKLSKIDPDTDAPAFIAEWLRRRPDAREGIEKEAFPKEKGSSAAKDLIMQSILQLMAIGALNKIKRMPEMIAVMLERLQDRRTDPAIRCGVAGILAYVVQPRDLI